MFLFIASTKCVEISYAINRNDTGINILVCSRGGGGLLFERMELVAELWEENIRVGNLISCKILLVCLLHKLKLLKSIFAGRVCPIA